MNQPKSNYKEGQHEIWKAVSVTIQQAHDLIDTAYIDNKGIYHAEAEELNRPSDTAYRGDVLICADGKTYGLAELYDTKYYGYGRYTWFFRNPRQVIEYDVRCYKGLFDAVFDIGDIETYPRRMVIGEDGWKKILAAMNETKPNLLTKIKNLLKWKHATSKSKT